MAFNMGSVSPSSLFATLETVPLDPHYALKNDYAADDAPEKVILGSGIYRDGDSRPWVLPSVKEAEILVEEAQDCNRYEYLPISGYAPFYTTARDLLFGSLGTRANHVTSLQTMSGTGANSLGAKFLAEALKPSAVWLSNPTWVNHANIWSLQKVPVKYYPFWNSERKALDFENMVRTLITDAAPGDVIVLHACAHNPTGVDPTKAQWKRIADICETQGLFPFFDCAYQGFATGDLNDDAWALRHFAARETLELAAAQSFSKNMGLYGERVGAFHLLTFSSEAAAKAGGHLCRIQRGQISNPPRRGAQLAATILKDEILFKKWLTDLDQMSSRIRNMRKMLYEELLSLETPGNWDHIVSQIGMFCYTGLSSAEVDTVQSHSHVYMLRSGRISVAGLTTKNVKHVAQAIDKAVRGVSA